uniref:Uncharacterized protein n=1 Tax=Anguilla anguilla TaxID=7936 RepID=A0A0E9S0V8_ANGAN
MFKTRRITFWFANGFGFRFEKDREGKETPKRFHLHHPSAVYSLIQSTPPSGCAAAVALPAV